MALKHASRIVKYIPASYPTERWKMLKDSRALKRLVDAGEGESEDVFNSNIIEKYEARPTTTGAAASALKNISLMEFVSW